MIASSADPLAGDAVTAARWLLGARLVRVDRQGRRGGLIVETEAYRPEDPASHSNRGQTARNRSMFGRPGIAYVYFTYGSCFCLNVVCEPEGVGAAVLLRALEPTEGLAEMARARRTERHLTSGPGRLCQALGIDRGLDGTDLLVPGELYLEPGEPVGDHLVVATPRIGISQGTDRPWRFAIMGNPNVSRPVGAARHAAF